MRLDYPGLDRIFSGKERAPEHVADAIAVARHAAQVLADNSKGAALSVTSDEPEFEFDEGATSLLRTSSSRPNRTGSSRS